ncbi:flagellar motor switch protein FliG [Treponema sp. OttesenSCG-928-L16]|nr:flagellar motor switch protein FliG [Treponema sp. OttesenSCG-928-L16]
MGKSRTPEDGSRARAIAAYSKTMKGENKEGFIKTGGAQGASPGAEKRGFSKTLLPEPEGREDSKSRKVAKFLILIGAEKAAAVLTGLEAEQVEEISREISSIRGITGEEAEAILGEFQKILSSPFVYSGTSSGGPEAARKILYAVYGAEKGEAILNRAVPETVENPLGFLEDFTGKQVAFLLKEESPAAAALVLSRLSPKQSAAVLAAAEPGRKLEIVKRIARLGESPPEVIERTAEALREKARHIGASEQENELDGRSALTAILKHSDSSFGDRLLDELEDSDPDLGRDLKERLYTLDDVVNAEDRPLQEKLRSMADRDIVLLLKNKSPEFTEKILANLSSSRRSLVKEEAEIMGPVPKRDADEAAKDFLAWFRTGREEGRILLIDDEDVV